MLVSEEMKEMNFKLGDMIEVDGLLASVVGLPDGQDVPDEHLAVWFGHPQNKRISEGKPSGSRPEVWTVPADCCTPAAPPELQH